MNVNKLYRELQKIPPKEQASLFARAWGIKGGSGGTDPPAAAASGDIAFDFQAPAFINGNLTAVATTTILSATESGLLVGVGGRVSVAPTGGLCAATLDFTIDGGAARSVQLYSASNAWHALAAVFYSAFSATAGDTIGEVFYMPLNIRYKTSVLVELDVATATTVGVIALHAYRGIEI